MQKAVKFNYLYRDASNYKSWGELIFSNPNNLSIDEIDNKLRNNFDQEIFFIAHEIGIPELFIYIEKALNEDDHCYHEYDSIEEIQINEEISDSITINKFIEKVKNAHMKGWKAFDPTMELENIKKRATEIV